MFHGHLNVLLLQKVNPVEFIEVLHYEHPAKPIVRLSYNRAIKLLQYLGLLLTAYRECQGIDLHVLASFLKCCVPLSNELAAPLLETPKFPHAL